MITSLPSQPIVVRGCRSWWTQLPSRERRHAFIDEIIISSQLICYLCLENNSVSNDHKHSILPAVIPIWPNLFAFSSCHGDFASKSNQIVKVQKFWNWSQWNGNFENLVLGICKTVGFFPIRKARDPVSVKRTSLRLSHLFYTHSRPFVRIPPATLAFAKNTTALQSNC